MSRVPRNDDVNLRQLGHFRVQRFILRLFAIATLAALPAIFLPHLALEKLAWAVGIKEPPHSPLLIYMIAGGSAVYVAQGALFWVMSTDLVRYRPMIVLIAWMLVLFGPLFVWIHLQSSTPRWWLLLDSLSCLVAGIALLWTCRSR